MIAVAHSRDRHTGRTFVDEGDAHVMPMVALNVEGLLKDVITNNADDYMHFYML